MPSASTKITKLPLYPAEIYARRQRIRDIGPAGSGIIDYPCDRCRKMIPAGQQIPVLKRLKRYNRRITVCRSCFTNTDERIIYRWTSDEEQDAIDRQTQAEFGVASPMPHLPAITEIAFTNPQ